MSLGQTDTEISELARDYLNLDSLFTADELAQRDKVRAFVDARIRPNIARWYEERFLSLQRGAFSNPRSYFHRFASLSEDEARTRARGIWTSINEPNLVKNILPTKARASLVLRKNADHAVDSVLLRKI